MGAQKRKKKSLLYGPAAWWWEMQEKLERERGKGEGRGNALPDLGTDGRQKALQGI